MKDIKIVEGGTLAKDKITGVKGVVTGFGHYYGMESDVYKIEYKNENGSLCYDWVQACRLEFSEKEEL